MMLTRCHSITYNYSEAVGTHVYQYVVWLRQGGEIYSSDAMRQLRARLFLLVAVPETKVQGSAPG